MVQTNSKEGKFNLATRNQDEEDEVGGELETDPLSGFFPSHKLSGQKVVICVGCAASNVICIVQKAEGITTGPLWVEKEWDGKD